MIERETTVRNEMGIHCRPSAAIVREMKEYPGELEAFSEGGQANCKSIMGLLTLGLAKGSQVKVRVEGPDEEVACARLIELFETEFDFPPK